MLFECIIIVVFLKLMVSSRYFYGEFECLVMSLVVCRCCVGLLFRMSSEGLVFEIMVVRLLVCSILIRVFVLGIVFVW